MYNIPNKYYLMYLPSKDKFQPGDHVIYTKDGMSSVNCTYIVDEKVCLIVTGFPEYNGESKAELFVCTDDIQVGDIVIERLITLEFEEFEIHTIHDIDLNNQTKIIGKVSPEAIWASQYLGIDEDEIETGGGSILYYNKTLTHWSKVKDDEYEYIKLMCNKCNSFH